MARRMSSAVVDLTVSSDPAESEEESNSPNYVHVVSSSPPSGQSSSSPSSQPVHEPRGVKRRRLSDSAAPTVVESSTASSSSAARANGSNIDLEGIESVDLTEVNDESALAKALAKQREDAVKAQASSEDKKGRSILTSHKCPVCMDTLTDATSTICGHLFCHKCIMDTLRFSEEQRADSASGKGPRGNCPVCRKPLSRRDAPGPKRDLVPLQLKLMTKKKSSSTSSS
ncbi:hypothetical protein VTN77DRAFT_3807 [Rasamsonia byssochlamydoides]|uniref:uncharacterized protein n=1 Tax=Rasamsonia byssochlamydoides TaxID=89139 RepID=UPI0037435665